MDLERRVVWSEGLFLRPQHLQHEERHLLSISRFLSVQHCPEQWGVCHCEFDKAGLSLGKVGLRRR